VEARVMRSLWRLIKRAGQYFATALAITDAAFLLFLLVMLVGGLLQYLSTLVNSAA
jgi:hypothetical protein